MVSYSNSGLSQYIGMARWANAEFLGSIDQLKVFPFATQTAQRSLVNLYC